MSEVEKAAVVWREARIAACAAPLGDATVWRVLGAAETALSEAVKAALAPPIPDLTPGRL